MFNIFLKLSLLALLSIGLYGALSVSYLTVTGIAPCPTIIGIPACFIVTTGYFLMFIATLLHKKNFANWLFTLGLTPVLLLALIGSYLELSVGNTCPIGKIGIPLCYVSLSFAMLVAMFYGILSKLKDID